MRYLIKSDLVETAIWHKDILICRVGYVYKYDSYKLVISYHLKYTRLPLHNAYRTLIKNKTYYVTDTSQRPNLAYTFLSLVLF